MADHGIVEKQQFSAREFQLMEELVQEQIKRTGSVEFEDLEGYVIPPRTQFSMLKKPAVTIKANQMNFNMSSVRLYEGMPYIIPMIDENRMRMAVIPCKEEELSCVEWARYRQKDNAWVNKQVTAKDFLAVLFQKMDWNPDCRYKILGERRLSSRGLILVFDLTEAIMYTTEMEETEGEEGVKPKRKTTAFFPNYYEGKMGKPFSDYSTTRQLNMFEDFSGFKSAEETVSDFASEQTMEQTTAAVEEAQNGAVVASDPVPADTYMQPVSEVQTAERPHESALPTIPEAQYQRTPIELPQREMEGTDERERAFQASATNFHQ